MAAPKHNAVLFQPKDVTVFSSEEVPKDQWLRLEDLEESDIDDQDGDIVIEQRLLVNNEVALRRLTSQVQWSDIPSHETLSYTASKAVVVDDVFDDLARETAFEQQALETVRMAIKDCRKHDLPFFPPENLLEDALTIKDRQAKANRQSEHIKLMKRKRKDAEADDTMTDDFDLADYQDNTMKSTTILRKRQSQAMPGKSKKKFGQEKKKKKTPARPGKARRMAGRKK
ncbi:hypothetical protein BC940DRAFT_309896 [Gongronella butleri]|nr:hypothetical protein BC940DRAFT_309896 [Gongronella butleri]